MATIKKTAAGTWRLRFYTGRDPETGKRRFVTKTFDRKKDADAEATRLKRNRDTGLPVTVSKEPLGEYLRRWLEDVKEGKIRARTLHEYRGMVRRYIEEPSEGAPPIGAVPLHRLTPAAFEELYAFLWKERGLAPRTLQYLHTVLRQAMGYAVKTGQLVRNPTDHVSPATQVKSEEGAAATQEKTVVRSMSEEEASAFLEASKADRHHALWCVLLTGGLRPGEALGLAWDHVNLDEGKLHVQRALTRVGVEGWKLVPPKTKKGRRVVVLPSVTIAALRAWRAGQAKERLLLGAEYEDHGFVFTNEFGSPLDGSNIYARNFNRIMAAAGLGTWGPEPPKPARGPSPARPFKPAFRMYDLRHTCATLLLKRGVNAKIVQERLGHASITLTLDTYSHVLPDMQEGAADELQAVFGGASGS